MDAVQPIGAEQLAGKLVDSGLQQAPPALQQVSAADQARFETAMHLEPVVTTSTQPSSGTGSHGR